MVETTGRLGEVLASRRRDRFVGRAAEVELFRAALESSEPPFSVLFVHGPGGIGKTSLLETLTGLAVDAGARVARLDGRDLPASPRAVLDTLGEVAEVADAGITAPGRLVLVLDTYERIASLDEWVRGQLVPRLPASALTVIAGREPPGPGWRADPAWRDLLRVVSLRNLSPAECRRYLVRCGVPPALHDRLLATSHGHPLGLSLLADLVTRGGTPVDGGVGVLPPELVGALVRQFVEVVPSAAQRRALEVSALARVTTEALLREVVGPGEAHETFRWLRGLSFMESGPDGVHPHELARDVLEVDLRWRDPEGFKDTFRRVRAQVHQRLRSSRGRAQQRAIVDEKYLFRNLPSILSPVDWSAWGAVYPEPAGSGDRPQIIELVRRWEGGESAAIARRWLAAQPDGFFVLRGEDGAVVGAVGLLDLTAASAQDRAADPGARAAWEYARRHAPPRPGETVTLTRWVVDRDAYQRPSPTLNAVPVLTIQRYLRTPRLAWDLLALAEPEQWDAYFAVADLPRAAGADFTVAGRRFGLFAHDFRRTTVDAWLELVTERALEQDFALPPPATAEALVLSREAFDDAARQALRDLRRLDLLARNPLLRSRLVRDRAGAREPDAVDLEGLLGDAIDALREHPRDDRLLRAVERTYVRPAGTQEAAAEALGVPFSSYRRHLTRGVARVVAWLWEREVYGPGHREPPRGR
jgi:energy-coupling factor transporter ATP-binding protein EcfA2